MNKLVIGVIGVVILGAGVYALKSNEEKNALMQKQAMEEAAIMEKEKMVAEQELTKVREEEGAPLTESKDESIMIDDDKMDEEKMMKDDMSKGAVVPAVTPTEVVSRGAYLPYEASKLAMAETGDVVLFFRASWCPGCRALDSDIAAHLEEIPSDLTILKLDYDTETELKKKYGVTTQHTLVQVDAQGNLIKKWSGDTKLTQIAATRI